jgi:alkanesulfonate monooxygenase SsuD/methylene tetrahydromethanopterin reductase-like flavin-dependent oxidoreductase (luciferase family)
MRTRLDVLEEQLQVVLGTWSSGPDAPFTFTGEHYRLDALNAQPGPVQTPHPPLIMGGSAGRRSAAMAARYADEYNTPFAAVDEVRERRARIAQACADAEREMLPFSVMTGVVIGADETDLRDRAARLEQRSGFQNLVDAPPGGWIVATVDGAAEQLQTLADAGVDRVMCQQLLHDDLEAVALLGEQLAPAVA